MDVRQYATGTRLQGGELELQDTWWVKKDARCARSFWTGKDCTVHAADSSFEQSHGVQDSKRNFVKCYPHHNQHRHPKQTKKNEKKMIEKKEGATMVCSACGATLTCRMSNYKHPYTNKLQWQNTDGFAHYSYNEGKFACTGTKQERKDLTKALQEQDEMIRESELSKGR